MPTDAPTPSTPTPWKVSLPDETLIVGPENEPVAATFRGDGDYDEYYSLRAADAALITRAVNAHEPAMKALREAYTVLAFAFNRLHGSGRSRDTELCHDFGKVRARIEKMFHDAGERL